MQYFFNFIESGRTDVDHIGFTFLSLALAEQEATVTAAALLKDAASNGKYDDVRIDVMGADGMSIFTVCASMKVERSEVIST